MVLWKETEFHLVKLLNTKSDMAQRLLEHCRQVAEAISESLSAIFYEENEDEDISGNVVRGIIKKKKGEIVEGDENAEVEEVSGVTDPNGQTIHIVGNDPDAPTSILRDESDGSELDVTKIRPEGKDAEEQVKDAIRKIAEQM